jgi:hypothetical protein
LKFELQLTIDGRLRTSVEFPFGERLALSSDMRLVHQHGDYITAENGGRYIAQVYAEQADERLWHAWCVFFREGKQAGDPVATDRETTQSSYDSVRYWASGLTHVFYEGALDRALAREPGAALQRHPKDAKDRATRITAELEAYRVAAEDAHGRAHEMAVIARAMRRGIGFG